MSGDSAFRGAYEETTRDIAVSVRPAFLEEQSSPEANQYVWAYQVRIENRSGEVVQLLRRYWRITDAHGRVQEVRGEGVVGEQPILRPGEAFEYTSGAPLATPSGFMLGTYFMVNEKGESFDIAVPPFSLDSPYAAGRIH